MSNVRALHAFSHNEPLRTIVEVANSDYEPTERGDSRAQQYEDIPGPEAARRGRDEWQSWASDISDTSGDVDDDQGSVKNGRGPKSGQAGPRTSSIRQAFLQESDSSDHASAQRSSRRGSATFSAEGSNTDATSAIQQSQREDMSDKEDQFVAPLDEFDLAAPIKDGDYLHQLESLADLLFASEHLKYIFADPSSLLDFTSFISTCRPQSIPMLMYYLDTTEALKAVTYALSITQSLEAIPGYDFTSVPTETTLNTQLEEKADQACNALVKEDLPAFMTQVYVQAVKTVMTRRIMGPSASPMQEALEGLLEVFCLTDPSRADNPIVFASEAFHRMTQYGMSYAIGRNCRFLQGPKTSEASIERIRSSLREGRDHCELVLNYRRDGSPFLNLLMLAPLRDMDGKVRYVLGAQIDVSNLVPDSTDGQTAASGKPTQAGSMNADGPSEKNGNKKGEYRDLGEMLDGQGGSKVSKWRAQTMQEESEDRLPSKYTDGRRSRVLLRDPSSDSIFDHETEGWVNSKLSGFYQNYLLIRPYPSLRILFASPSLQLPGMLQAPIMDKIKVSNEVGEELTQALAQGRSVTAKVRWISKPGDRGRNRWIAFTPLVGSHKQIGVWIAILVDDEVESRKRPRRAPPVKWRVGGPPIPTPKKPSTTPAHAAVTTDVNNRVPADMPWEQPVPVPSLSERPLSSPKEPPAPAVPPKPAVTAAVAAHVTQPKPASVLEGDPDIDENYETLEVRLRKKRERDAARLLDQPGAAAVKPTYKSLSPYAFMNNDAP